MRTGLHIIAAFLWLNFSESDGSFHGEMISLFFTGVGIVITLTVVYNNEKVLCK